MTQTEHPLLKIMHKDTWKDLSYHLGRFTVIHVQSEISDVWHQLNTVTNC